MPDDKSKVGEPDRSKVAKDQDYEVSHLAQEYGISKDLPGRLGPDSSSPAGLSEAESAGRWRP